MIELAIIAAGVALGFFIIMIKMGFRRVLAYDLYVDIGLTILLMVMFSGSFSGMVVALLTGLLVGIVLLVCRVLFGTEKYEEVRLPNGRIKGHWVKYKGLIT